MQINILFFTTLIFLTIACKAQPTQQSSSVGENSIIGPLPAIDNDEYFVKITTDINPQGPTVITRNLHQDRNGTIWMATYQGLVSYKNKKYRNHTYIDNLRKYRIFSLLENKKGEMFFGTQGAGIYIHDGQKFTNFTTSQGLINDKIGWMTQAKNEDIWIGTLRGVSVFDGKSFNNHTIPGEDNNNDVNCIIQDKTGKIWVASRGGVSIWNGAEWQAFEPKDYGPLTNTRTLILDRESNIWLGGQSGLYKFDGVNTIKYSSDFIGNLYLDHDGKILFSASNDQKFKMSLNRIDLETKKIHLIKQEPSQVFGIMRDRNGLLWYGTDRGVFSLNDQ
jgi:ligand-binding sensor domain-containing protein